MNETIDNAIAEIIYITDPMLINEDARDVNGNMHLTPNNKQKNMK
jgi:hypothetical protein